VKKGTPALAVEHLSFRLDSQRARGYEVEKLENGATNA